MYIPIAIFFLENNASKICVFKIIILNALILLKYYDILGTLCSVMNILYSEYSNSPRVN